MDKKREIPEKRKGDNMIDEVVRAEAVGLYPDSQTDGGMIPRSKAESRAGIDGDGESSTDNKKKH